MANEKHPARLRQGFENVLAMARHALASGAAFVYVGGTWIAERQVQEGIRDTSRRVMARLRSISWQDLARRYQPLLIVLGALLLLIGIWKIPQWYAASWELLPDPRDRAKLESDTRTTMVQAAGGIVLLIGLFFTAKTLRTTQEGQITDRFTKAINQLGETGPEKLAIRLGGIYALERIARDSERDHWPIMEILTAYVREHAPWAEDKKDHLPLQPDPSVQAVLTVLGRRPRTYHKGEKHGLDLTLSNLRFARLESTHLEGANLANTHLEGALLTGAHLENAFLSYTHLEGANLAGAHLENAVLSRTHLEEANLAGAHLEGVWGLTVEQLAGVKTLHGAHLDPPLLAQIEELYPQLRERPLRVTENS
jgi:Pentapeptide repeats (8 copies)